MHKGWCSLDKVPFFSRSSIWFLGHTDWKIMHLNPIGVRLLGRSQLSNPSDSPCCGPSMWAFILFFWLISSPRYLHLSPSYWVWSLSLIYDFFPFPILTTLHFAGPNSMWYFNATWFMMFFISCRIVMSWCVRHILLILFLFLGYVLSVRLIFRLSEWHFLWQTVLILVLCCLWF